MKTIFSILLALCSLFATAQTSLSGKVTDAKTGEAFFAVNVVLYKSGKIITGAETDFDGNYSITGLDAGTYDVRCSLVGMSDNLITGYTIGRDKANVLDIAMENAIDLSAVVVKIYKNKNLATENENLGKQHIRLIADMPTKKVKKHKKFLFF